MTATNITTGLTKQEAIRRAEALVTVLAERAAATEQLRRVPDESISDLKQAGLVSIARPERFGGPGLDYDAAFEVGYTLAQGCASTAWITGLTHIHDYAAGRASVQAQEAYFSAPDTMSASAFAPMGKVTPVDGGWMFEGAWATSSGCDHATWVLLGGAVVEGDMVLAMVPRDAVEIVDDWHVAGLRGTGSKTVRISEPVFVPEWRWIPRFGGDANLEMRDEYERPSYGAPVAGMLPFPQISVLLGTARAAVDTFAKQAMERRIPGGARIADQVPIQVRLAESEAEVDAALLLARSTIAELMKRGAAGDTFSVEDRVTWRRNHAYVAKLCVQAVNRVYDAAGGGAIYDRNPMQRFHRDVHAGSHHIGLNWDDNSVLYGRVRLGLEPQGLFW
ncbi:acyl-CoA dehydrogenase family protein [Georgenia sp. SYP-B2076]|uniref:acyl-CoA dehydrogenase family protein n=1 Tax=Georgenia sp. SYP-B2076 TaxID=2495881 RepID=UPI000F8D8A57|nr:acyl-CoA dehydrogenase family protein [Georgenia sp. SYP-B2076]